MDKKRRVLETLKTLLILALTCSALWLLTDSPLFGQLSGMLSHSEQGASGQGSASGQSQSMLPLRMAVMSQGGCYGVQYAGEELSALYDRTAPLLNEAVSSTGAPQPISREDWERALLSDPAIYFDFQGVLPLQVLSGWLSGRENPELTARVRYLLLAAGEGGEVRLCYRDEDLDQFFSCPTELVSLTQLQSVAAGVMANGAIFACQSEEYDQLAPYTLISARTPTPSEYLAVNPLDEQEERLEMLLDTLSFPLGITTIYDTPEGRRVRSGNDTLTISNGGVLTYHSGREEARYPIVQREGYSPVFAAAETARELVNDVVQPWLGDARLYLRQMAARESGWLIEFGYALNETPVQMDQRGCAARVLVEDGHISEFEIQLRTYTVQEQTTLILPQPQAAAALVQMERAGSALQLCYRDQGENVRAGWTAD